MDGDLRRETDEAAGTYLAAPAEGAGLGVLVIAGADSVDGAARSFCDRLAAEGFTGLAVAASTELSGAVDALQAHDAVRGHGVAVAGVGAGATAALRLAALRADVVRAVLAFDVLALSEAGSGIPDVSGVRASVEGHYGEGAEGSRTAGLVHRLQEVLEAQGCDARLFTYPLVSPGFTDEGRPDGFHEDSARQAWVRSLEFLRAKLG